MTRCGYNFFMSILDEETADLETDDPEFLEELRAVRDVEPKAFVEYKNNVMGNAGVYILAIESPAMGSEARIFEEGELTKLMELSLNSDFA